MGRGSEEFNEIATCMEPYKKFLYSSWGLWCNSFFFAMPGYYWICWTTRIKGRPRSDGECAETLLSMGHFRIASSLHFKTRLHRSFFYMTSLYPFLVYKTMEWRTELSLVPSNLHGHWSWEWKQSISQMQVASSLFFGMRLSAKLLPCVEFVIFNNTSTFLCLT